ncbi:MAG: hypothetical protein ABSC04_09540 [Syntrophobacteraceae bacterium]|jgi:hypothetical protein
MIQIIAAVPAIAIQLRIHVDIAAVVVWITFAQPEYLYFPPPRSRDGMVFDMRNVSLGADLARMISDEATPQGYVRLLRIGSGAACRVFRPDGGILTLFHHPLWLKAHCLGQNT